MIPDGWKKVSAGHARTARSKARSAGVTEKGIEKAIQEAFLLVHRIKLAKTDAGGSGVKGLLANPPRWLLDALGIRVPLPWGLLPSLLIPPGFPDLTGQTGEGRWIFVEVKKPGGTFRPGQKEFLEAAQLAGAVAFRARSVDEALATYLEKSA